MKNMVKLEDLEDKYTLLEVRNTPSYTQIRYTVVFTDDIDKVWDISYQILEFYDLDKAIECVQKLNKASNSNVFKLSVWYGDCGKTVKRELYDLSKQKI